MKNSILNTAKILITFSMLLLTLCSSAQNPKDSSHKKQTVAIVDFDTKGYNFNQQQAIQFVINELIRIGTYEVMDKYEVDYIAKKDTLSSKDCFSKPCLSEFGRRLKTDKMFTGSIQLLGDRVNITLRLLDVKTQSFEKTIVKEFLNIPGNELMMIRVTINEMFGIQSDQDVVRKLTIKTEFDNAVNNPYKMVLKADGPRVGIVGFSGINSQVLRNPANQGGYDAYPFMFQFGYQFEKQYLNEGNFQALIEMIPTISGMDQGRLIPSFTFLNGLRNNKTGWEFAFGPTFNIVKMSKGFYYDKDGNGSSDWLLEKDKALYPDKTFDIVKRVDSRGILTPTAGFLFAAGKTFKSGKMNIPLNIFIVPNLNGFRFGLSFGWNGKERYELSN